MKWDEAPEQYHKWYYDNDVWRTTSFLGVNCQKSVSDLWNYQEILFELQTSLVIEFGSYFGGSALYFSLILQQISQSSKVLSVDINHGSVNDTLKENPNIEFMKRSSADPEVAERIKHLRKEHPGPVFFILDSDHSKQHVLEELKLLRAVTRSGDYVIVEDSNINGHPVLPGWGEGPMEAIIAYESEYPDDYAHDHAREEKFGFSFAPKGFLIRS